MPIPAIEIASNLQAMLGAREIAKEQYPTGFFRTSGRIRQRETATLAGAPFQEASVLLVKLCSSFHP